MKRTTEFRGECKFKKDWWFGFYIYSEYENKHFIVQNAIDNKQPNVSISFAHFTEVFPDTIGEFTGVYDKDNKKVYEGDILEVIYYNHTGKNCKLIQEVYYLEESGCFCVKTIGKEVSTIDNDRNNVPLSWTSQPNTIRIIGRNEVKIENYVKK